MSTLLERIGLGRRELRAWAMYDWANSAFQTTIVAAVFPIFFQKVAAAGMPGPMATAIAGFKPPNYRSALQRSTTSP